MKRNSKTEITPATRGLLVRQAVIIALLGLTALAITHDRPVELDASPGIRTQLPRTIGPWRGQRILFCQNEDCLHSFRESERSQDEDCPDCGGHLSPVSLPERQILPGDTVIEKMMYERAGGPEMYVSIVVSGLEQRSIHRPQQCLPAQGTSIETTQNILIDGIPGRAPIHVAVLTTRTRTRAGSTPGFYAYWFTGGGHETPYHIERLLLNAFARVFQNRAPRWAYVALSANRQSESESYLAQLKDFVRLLVPELEHNNPETKGSTP